MNALKVLKLFGLGAAMALLALAAGNQGEVGFGLSQQQTGCPPMQPYAFCTFETRTAGPVAFSPDGLMLAANTDGRAALWDVTNGQQVRSFDTYCWSLAFSPDGYLLGCANSVAVYWWEANTGEEVFQDSVDDYSLQILQVAFSPDGQLFAAADWDDGIITLWDVSSRSVYRTIYAGYGKLSIAFSPDGKRIASAAFNDRGDRGEIKLWDVYDGSLIRQFYDPHYAVTWGRSVAFSPPDGELLAVQTQGRLIVLWDVATGKVRQYISAPGDPSPGRGTNFQAVAFSPDGKLLATGSCVNISEYSCRLYGRAGEIELWDVGSGNLVRTLSGAYYGIESVAFSPDGGLLASGSNYPISYDQVRIWYVGDLTGGGPPTQVLTVCSSGCDYNSIQEAIDDAPSGGLIKIESGTYEEGLFINKSLTLRGAGPFRTILDGYYAYRASGITVAADAVVTIEGIGVRGFDSWGLYAGEYARVTVKNSQFSENDGGVVAYESAQITLTGSAMNDNWNSPGVYATDSSSVTMSQCEVMGNGNAGVVAVSGARLTIEGSVVSQNAQSGIVLGHSAQAWILNNEIYYNYDWGIHAQSPYNIVKCSGNDVKGNGRGNYNSAAAERCN